MRCFILFSPQETVDWFNAIRAARFHYLQVAFPVAPTSEVSMCTHSLTRMHKHSFARVAAVKGEQRTSQRAFAVSIQRSSTNAILTSLFFFAEK